MENIRGEIEAIDKKIKGIPKMEFKSADGLELSQQEADEERETIYNAYSEERVLCEKRLKRQELALEGHRNWSPILIYYNYDLCFHLNVI